MPLDPVMAQQLQNANAMPPKLRAKVGARMGKPGHTQSAGLQDFLSPFHLGIWGAPGYQGEETSGITRALPMGRTRDLTNQIQPTMPNPMGPPQSPTSALAVQTQPDPVRSALQRAADEKQGMGYGGGIV